jgi:hypothetical protein
LVDLCKLAGVQEIAAQQPGEGKIDLPDVQHAGRIVEPTDFLQRGFVKRAWHLFGELGPISPTSLHVRLEELWIVPHRQKSSVGQVVG